MAKSTNEHARHFNEKEFWKKVKTAAKAAGQTVIESAMTLYYVLQDKDTPLTAKGIILGALGYFILPFDVIPDFLPGGFVDDLAVLGAAMSAVAVAVKDVHKKEARDKVKEWFGDGKVKPGGSKAKGKAKGKKAKAKKA